jgi:hypothetical protein
MIAVRGMSTRLIDGSPTGTSVPLIFQETEHRLVLGLQ